MSITFIEKPTKLPSHSATISNYKVVVVLMVSFKFKFFLFFIYFLLPQKLESLSLNKNMGNLFHTCWFLADDEVFIYIWPKL